MSLFDIAFEGLRPWFNPWLRPARVRFGIVLLLSLNGCKEAAPESSPSIDSNSTPNEEPSLAQKDVPEPTFSKGTLQGASGLRATRVRRAHALADQAQTKEQVKKAETELESLFLQLKGNPDPRAIAIAQDLAARAVAFKLQAGDNQGARALAVDALAVSEEPTVMRANLLIALADINERLDNPMGARAALMGALKINQQLLEKELANP